MLLLELEEKLKTQVHCHSTLIGNHRNLGHESFASMLPLELQEKLKTQVF
jgi:hypothetical protein